MESAFDLKQKSTIVRERSKPQRNFFKDKIIISAIGKKKDIDRSLV